MTDTDLRPIDSFNEENRSLVAALRGDDEHVRVAVLEEICEADDELADELLRILHSDADDSFRADVAIALGPTLELCNDELDEHGRIEHTEWGGPSLSQAAYERVVEGLHRVYLDTTASKELRRRAVEGSVRSPKPWHESAIREAWASGDEEWRLTAVFAMGYCYDHDFSAEIEQAFRSGSVELQREAIRTASLRGVEHLLTEVIAIAQDPRAEKHLRYAAVEAIGYMGNSDNLELLEDLQLSKDVTLAEIAEDAANNIVMAAEAEEIAEELDFFGE